MASVVKPFSFPFHIKLELQNVCQRVWSDFEKKYLPPYDTPQDMLSQRFLITSSAIFGAHRTKNG